MVSVEGTLLKNADCVYCLFGVEVGSVFTSSRWYFLYSMRSCFVNKIVYKLKVSGNRCRVSIILLS